MTSHVPAQAFILVSLGSLFVLMVGWRIAYVYVFASGEKAVPTKANRRGGVFEFFEVWPSSCLNPSSLSRFCHKISLGKHSLLSMITMII